MSFKVGISTEFATKLFGVAGFKISAQFSTTGSWKKGITTTSVESKMESYSFQFTVPKKCDARISIMKEFIPVRTDWRAKFHISGKVEVSLMVSESLESELQAREAQRGHVIHVPFPAETLKHEK